MVNKIFQEKMVFFSFTTPSLSDMEITVCFMLQDNLQILRDLSLLQIQMRDLEGYKVVTHMCFLLTLKLGVIMTQRS